MSMNIVRYLGNKKVLSTLGGTLLFLVAMQRAFTPHSVSVTCDPRWASEYQQVLKKHVKDISLRTTGAAGIKRSLEDDYPFLKEVTIAYSGALRAQVKLTGWLPKVRISSSRSGKKDYILCQDGPMLEKQYFTAAALEGVPTLILEGSDFEAMCRAPELIETALRLTNTHFDGYTIIWKSKTQILLFDKEKNIMIIADMHSIHELERFDYVARIYAQEEKYKQGMKADIRLKDSLVCAPINNYTKAYEKSNNL